MDYGSYKGVMSLEYIKTNGVLERRMRSIGK